MWVIETVQLEVFMEIVPSWSWIKPELATRGWTEVSMAHQNCNTNTDTVDPWLNITLFGLLGFLYPHLPFLFFFFNCNFSCLRARFMTPTFNSIQRQCLHILAGFIITCLSDNSYPTRYGWYFTVALICTPWIIVNAEHLHVFCVFLCL